MINEIIIIIIIVTFHVKVICSIYNNTGCSFYSEVEELCNFPSFREYALKQFSFSFIIILIDQTNNQLNPYNNKYTRMY